MKEKFLSEYEIVRMSRNSLLVCNKRTSNRAYIHRNIFNQLDQATDYREVDITFANREDKSRWIEVLIWKAI